MEQHKLSAGPLLDAQGALCEAGYATSLVKQYDRKCVRGGPLRIKEWDYYLITNGDFGIALTADDNSYMGLVSASFLDFRAARERTKSQMFWLPLGKTNFPATSVSGDVRVETKGAYASFLHEGGKRHLTLYMDNFEGDTPFMADLWLYDEPRDSMVIATPFPEKPAAFYYNQKIIGMRAEGYVEYNGKTYPFAGDRTFGLLDWGRGVWTYDNTWYWGAGQGEVDGHTFGFNIGYGFGDTSAASENMLFYDGIAHKLSQVTFHIPQKSGKDDYLSPWTFSSDDGRFEMDFVPIIDRESLTSAAVILSDQHQVFGRFTGKAVLDDGTAVTLKDFSGFAEKVRNKW